ncbi:MAG: type II toxin-antitoxin system HicA family toxin [Oscillospiraceae bacterium]|nr:type II toxin-antitoxin system HicA family toxin [Oscillospiraceae bacterium]
MTGVEMIKLLKQNGFEVIKVKGSHYHMAKDGAYVIVPHHNKELGKGIYNRIMKDAELK